METPKYFFSNYKGEELGYTPVFRKWRYMVAAILDARQKMHKGDFWGLFGIRLARCPGIIPEKKSAFCNFIPGSCVFFTNALALNNRPNQRLTSGSLVVVDRQQ